MKKLLSMVVLVLITLTVSAQSEDQFVTNKMVVMDSHEQVRSVDDVRYVVDVTDDAINLIATSGKVFKIYPYGDVESLYASKQKLPEGWFALITSKATSPDFANVSEVGIILFENGSSMLGVRFKDGSSLWLK